MNKNGDIPILLSFLVAVILVIITMVSFATFENDFVTDSEGRNDLLGDVDFFEKYIVSESELVGFSVIENGGLLLTKIGLEGSFKDEIEKRDIGIKGLEDFFTRIEKNEFKFDRVEEGYLLSVDEVVLEFSSGANSVKRRFGFRIEYDSDGKVVGRDVFGVEKGLRPKS